MNGHEHERARQALRALDPGIDRNQWVKVGMAAKAAGLEFEDFDQWSAGAGNYSGQRDCAAVWRSIKNHGGIGAGTLFALARECGFSDSKPREARQEAPGPAKSRDKGKREAFDVQAVWSASSTADKAHPYIVKKNGTPDGLKVYRGPLKVAGRPIDGALIVPAFGNDGKIATLQFILPDGTKLNAPGRQMAGAFALGKIRPPGDGATIFVCEGIGQAWACHQATGSLAVVAFGAGRMDAAVKQFRGPFPGAGMVLVTDAGKEHQGAEIAKVNRCAWVEMPEGSPQNFDANDLAKRDGLEALAARLTKPKAHPQRFRLMSADELVQLPTLGYRIKGVLPAFGVAAFYGPSSSGKTFLVLDAVANIADGLSWFGYRSNACPVVYIGLEGSAGLPQRVQAHRIAKGKHRGQNVRFITAPLSLMESGDLRGLADSVKAAGAGAGVVVIDTLNAAAPGADENSSADMGRIIAGAKALQADIGGLVVLVHHTGKDAARGLRGHSSLFAALDAAIEVTRDGDRREWVLAKAKDGEDGKSHPFKLAVVELGIDGDGDAITSCVVEPAERTAETVRKANLPKGGNQQIALSALRDLLRDARQFGMAGAPPTRPCIELEEAISKIRDRLSVEPDRKTERTRAAITGLVNRGAIVLREGWLWLA